MSEELRSIFDKVFPRYSKKAVTILDINNPKTITSMAQQPISLPSEDGLTLVTVGRLVPQKGYDIAAKAAWLLKKRNVKFHWYVVGGGDSALIEKDIAQYGISDCFTLLGAKENPYPYMKACTIYVQTSTSEGWCLTTQEARILHKPCVVTDIPVMHEQFADGENGIIANGTDAVSLYNGIMRLIKSPDLCNRIIKNLESIPQNGVMELNKLYDFLDE